MSGISTHTKIIAGTPIEAGGRRFLPSVMVTTLESNTPGGGIFHVRRLRPISVVEESAETKRWHAIPDATQNALSQMAAVALGVAAASILILLVQRLARK